MRYSVLLSLVVTWVACGPVPVPIPDQAQAYTGSGLFVAGSDFRVLFGAVDHHAQLLATSEQALEPAGYLADMAVATDGSSTGLLRNLFEVHRGHATQTSSELVILGSRGGCILKNLSTPVDRFAFGRHSRLLIASTWNSSLQELTWDCEEGGVTNARSLDFDSSVGAPGPMTVVLSADGSWGIAVSTFGRVVPVLWSENDQRYDVGQSIELGARVRQRSPGTPVAVSGMRAAVATMEGLVVMRLSSGGGLDLDYNIPHSGLGGPSFSPDGSAIYLSRTSEMGPSKFTLGQTGIQCPAALADLGEVKIGCGSSGPLVFATKEPGEILVTSWPILEGGEPSGVNWSRLKGKEHIGESPTVFAFPACVPVP
jgi:hypothetical protein